MSVIRGRGHWVKLINGLIFVTMLFFVGELEMNKTNINIKEKLVLKFLIFSVTLFCYVDVASSMTVCQQSSF